MCVLFSGFFFSGSLFIAVVRNSEVFNFLTLGYIKVLFLQKSCTPADLKTQMYFSPGNSHLLIRDFYFQAGGYINSDFRECTTF